MRLIVSLAAIVALGGCVIVDDDNSGSVADQTDRALAVCGQGNVAEVTEDGFRCKAD